MNKLVQTLLIFGVVTLSTYADNTVTVNGTVLPAAVVGFVDVSGQTLTSPDFFLDAMVDMGSTEPDHPFTTVTNHFYTKSNNSNGVQVKITPAIGENNHGWLTLQGGTENIQGTYYFNGFNTYTMGEILTITTAPTDGTGSGKTFVFAPQTPVDQTAGIYDVTLDVEVICP